MEILLINYTRYVAMNAVIPLALPNNGAISAPEDFLCVVGTKYRVDTYTNVYIKRLIVTLRDGIVI